MCAFAFGARTGVRITLIPSPLKIASKARLNFGGPLEEGGCRGQATARLSAAGRPLELRGDSLVQPGRRLGAMPGAAIRIDLWVGRLRQRAVDSSPLAG